MWFLRRLFILVSLDACCCEAQATREARMNLHRNARLTAGGRRLLVERVCSQQVALSGGKHIRAIARRGNQCGRRGGVDQHRCDISTLSASVRARRQRVRG